ncbi:hypothetical protein BDR05DRAFT_1002410 [Suillus weaverae]|nr:hypothetical protein BDR05DRAFT_1002410 [Suillus weaverae]
MPKAASTVPKRMTTQARNATQHPGQIIIKGSAKRCTKAQKAADNQHEKEARKMMTDQAAVCVDVPKPGCPCACPIMKAVKALEASNLTIAGSQASAEITSGKAVDTQGRGGQSKLAASADVEDPTSEDKMEGQVPRAHKKKGRKIIPVKMPVRDAIQATESLINGSMEACYDDLSVEV